MKIIRRLITESLQNHFVHHDRHIATTDKHTHRQAIQQSLHIIRHRKKVRGFALGRFAMQGHNRGGKFHHQWIIRILEISIFLRICGNDISEDLGLLTVIRHHIAVVILFKKKFRHHIFGQQATDFMKCFLFALCQIGNGWRGCLDIRNRDHAFLGRRLRALRHRILISR